MSATIPAGRWELDLGTGQLTLCQHSRTMFGLPSGAAGPIREEEWVPRIHSGDLMAIRRALRASLTGGTIYAERFRVARPDGSLRDIFGVGCAVGEPTDAARIVGWNVDIAASAGAARPWAGGSPPSTKATRQIAMLTNSEDQTSLLAPRQDGPEAELLKIAEAILRVRQARGQILGHAMLAGPAFDLFLTLYVLSAKTETVSLSSLATATGIPMTSALRWVAYLVDKGLILRTRSAADRRVMSVRLTDLGCDALHRYLALQ